MYRFVKLRDNRTKMEYKWMLLVTSFEYVLAHDMKYMDTIITNGLHEYISKDLGAHYRSHWALNISRMQELQGGAIHNVSGALQARVTEGKARCLKSCGNVLIRESGSYMTLPSDYTILDEVISSELVYPEYSIEDIYVFQWQGGSHYYAKIGELDVDIHNACKWNTQEYAYSMALEFYYNIYK